jgi:release factor glutamine methyltransferase
VSAPSRPLSRGDVPASGTPTEFARYLAMLDSSWTHLACKPEETAAATLHTLWLAAAGQPCSVERALERPLPPLAADERERLGRLIERRRAGVPLAHLTGRQTFMGVELLALPNALIPRRETELLGVAARDVVRRAVAERGRALVIDLCTGSGNLALALAHHEPGCTVVGGDVSAEAVELARQNAEHTGLADRVRFVEGDLYAPFDTPEFRGAVDVIVCNPPYVPSSRVAGMATEIAEHEPRLAFDGGAFGLSVLLKLVAGAPRFLKPGSWLCFEVGAGQGEPMAARVERGGGYAIAERVLDPAGRVRALVARTRNPAE